MAKGRAVAIVLDDAERGELTALTRKHGARKHWRNERGLFSRRRAGSTTKRLPPRSASVQRRLASRA